MNLRLLTSLFIFLFIIAGCSKNNNDSLPSSDGMEDSTANQDPAKDFVYETFEGSTTKNYDVDTIAFKTGDWILSGAITAGTSADLFTGEQGIRMQGKPNNSEQEGMVSMHFDMKGITAVCISYGIYPAKGELANSNPTTFDIEISQDKGKTYLSYSTT